MAGPKISALAAMRPGRRRVAGSSLPRPQARPAVWPL